MPDPAADHLPFTERNMNPQLKGRDMRKAFDTGDAHKELMTQFLSNKAIQPGFGKLILEMLTKSA